MFRGDHLNRRDFIGRVAMTAVAASLSRQLRATSGWSAGVATADITPTGSLWMAGFALRKQPSQGVALPLHAKALALRCGGEPPAVLVTTDLLGLTARITDRVSNVLKRRHRIPRANLMFNASHTHCGPVIDEQLSVA